MKEYTISFTGHRPKGLPWGYNENLPQAIKFKQEMRILLIEKINQGYYNFIVGMIPWGPCRSPSRPRGRAFVPRSPGSWSMGIGSVALHRPP